MEATKTCTFRPAGLRNAVVPATLDRMQGQQIPSFFLYGEPPRAVADRFLHLESLDDRTRPSNWNIRAHSHANLSHIFYIAAGGGRMRAEDETIAFAAPCVLLVPARNVHAFDFEVDTSGTVLTLSEAYLAEIVRRDADLSSLFAAPAQVPLDEPQALQDQLKSLGRELAWQAPGHTAAVESLLTGVFIQVLRRHHASQAGPPAPHGSQAGLVARFRSLVEDHYRSEIGVRDYAWLLAVTPKRLRSACLRVTGEPPLRILHERRLLEAKRLMLYSNMTLAEIAYYLGFSDPAYFSRFFRQAAGASPRDFRRRAA